jgi:hypothetical protein
MKVFPRRLYYTGSEADGPPKTVSSNEVVDRVAFLSYGTQPYDVSTDGDEDMLRAALEMPDRFAPVSLP